MGGKKRITMVGSQIYNLAGDIKDRQDFVKSVVLSNVLSGTSKSVGEDLVNSIMTGNGIRLNRFLKWVERKGYHNYIDYTVSSFNAGNSFDQSILIEELPIKEGYETRIIGSDIGSPNYNYFIEQWLSDNRPDLINEIYIINSEPIYDIDTGEETDVQITLEFDNGENVTFLDSNLNIDSQGEYIFCKYYYYADVVANDVVDKGTTILNDEEEFPDRTDWDLLDENVEEFNDVLNITTTITKTYSDGRPNEVVENTVTNDVVFDEITTIYTRTAPDEDYEPPENEDDLKDLIEKTETVTQVDTKKKASDTIITTSEEIVEGVVITTTTEVVTETLDTYRYYKETEQVTYRGVMTNSEVFIYKKGTGNANLDSLFTPVSGGVRAVPMIPIRVKNRWVKDAHNKDLADIVEEAFEKLTNSSLDDVRKNLSSSGSLGDIDYAYIINGVSLNTKEQIGMEYLYLLFKDISNDPNLGSNFNFDEFLEDWNTAYQRSYALDMYRASARLVTKPWTNNQYYWVYDRPYPGPPIPYPILPHKRMVVRSNNSIKWLTKTGLGELIAKEVWESINLNITITWSGMSITRGIGIHPRNIKVGSFATYLSPQQRLPKRVSRTIVSGSGDNRTKRTIRETVYNTFYSYKILHQIDSNNWEEISVHDLHFDNLINRGKSAVIEINNAMADPEESGFVMPLIVPVFNQLSLLKRTKIANATRYLMLNYYESKKQKWYETGLFKLVLIVVMVVVTIYFPPAGPAGWALTAGTAVGLTGIALTIAAYALTFAASVILVKVLTAVASEIFGEEWGIVIGTIAAVATMSAVNGVSLGQTLTESLGQLMRADNILMFTQAGLDSYSNYLQQDSQKMMNEAESIQEKYNKDLNRLRDLQDKMTGGGILTPEELIELRRKNSYIPESMDSFIQRTLMTGSDVANMSKIYIDQFVEITNNLDLAR